MNGLPTPPPLGCPTHSWIRWNKLSAMTSTSAGVRRLSIVFSLVNTWKVCRHGRRARRHARKEASAHPTPFERVICAHFVPGAGVFSGIQGRSGPRSATHLDIAAEEEILADKRVREDEAALC